MNLTGKEPALVIGVVLSALSLAAQAQAGSLTWQQASISAVPLVAAFISRLVVFSPASVEKIKAESDAVEQELHSVIEALQHPASVIYPPWQTTFASSPASSPGQVVTPAPAPVNPEGPVV